MSGHKGRSPNDANHRWEECMMVRNATRMAQLLVWSFDIRRTHLVHDLAGTSCPVTLQVHVLLRNETYHADGIRRHTGSVPS